MTGIRENVARAILTARYQRDNERLNLNMSWDKLGREAHDVYFAQADAAIAVIKAEVLAVIPGGSSCDPQQVADDIRRVLGWADKA